MFTAISIRPLATIVLFLAASSCSVPNLETAGCDEARNEVKRFYSLHFANESNPNPGYQAEKSELITPNLKSALSVDDIDGDYFTKTRDFPKAFRVGTCESLDENRTRLQVVLLWRDDTRNEQSEVTVTAARTDGKWLINSVER